ncbi:MAG: hypothetical protein ABIT37_02785 [Luteolibacter sp.]
MKKNDHVLVQQVLDGAVTQDAFNAFQNRLRAEPELAKLYGEYALLNHTLCEEFEGQKWTERPLLGVGRSFSALYLILAVAAVLAILTVVFRDLLTGRPVPLPLANASFSMDAVWQVEGTHRTSGSFVSLFAGNKVHLGPGQASVALGSGTTAVIEGPAEITLESGKSLVLSEGRGRFRMFDPNGELKVVTPSFTAVDLGTEFGIDVHSGRPDELHVIDGKVRMLTNSDGREFVLTNGEAVRVNTGGSVEKIAGDGGRFLKELGRFQTVFSSPFVKADCRLQYGNPVLSDTGMDGENYSAFFVLKEPEPGDGRSVLLATLEVGKPAAGEFHTDGWAGMSFFNKGVEVLFFGDSFGTTRTWSLDVKQHVPLIMPGEPVLGPRTVTLRYDKVSGDVTLHQGGVPLGETFCSGKLPPGTEFDEIRLGASAGAALDVRSLTIRSGGGR